MNPNSKLLGRYDVIVIGSGIGGATAGILLARYFGKRVLLLEKHWQFGGLTHEFVHKGNSFATGLHYIGGVNDGSIPDKIFDIITDGQVSWLPMPHRYDEMVFPSFSYAFPASPKQFLEDMSTQFPKEKKAIKQFLTDVEIAFRFLGISNAVQSMVPPAFQGILGPLRKLLGFDPNISLQRYLDQRFENPSLKALLAAQWCDHGVLPEDASFMVHAMIMTHYLKGAFYPRGGPATISRGMQASLKKYGASVLLKTPVTQILTKRKRAYGVEVETEDGGLGWYAADHVISNAGAVATYQQLLRQHSFNFLQRDQDFLLPKHDFFSIYLSLKESPKKLGFDGSNKWIFRTEDHNKTILSPRHTGYPGFYCLMFPSLKARDRDRHTVEILTMVDQTVFLPWKGSAWKKREQSYYDLKSSITEKILADVEERYPGFSSLIQHYDSSSPLTTEKFLSRKNGASYGIPFSTRRHKMGWLSNQTPIQNLYLSGQDAFGPGVMAAMMGGVGAAAKVLGVFGYPQIMANVIRHNKQSHEPGNNTQISLTVKAIKDESPDTYSILCEPHSGLSYRAGQFLVLDIPVGGQLLRRSYSLSSAPEEPCPTFTIKRIPGGVVSNHLCTHLKPGHNIQATLPKGKFFVKNRDREKDLVLIAAGSGITPIYSIIKHSLSNQVHNRIHLIYACRTAESAIFKSSLDQLQMNYPSYLKVSYCFSQENSPFRPGSRIQQEEILRLIQGFNPGQTLVYVCAPGGLVKMVKEALEEVSYPEQHFYYESFSAENILSSKETSLGQQAKFTLVHKSKPYKGQVKPGKTLLSATLEEGFPITYSCMNGDCGVCQCRLLEGEVVSANSHKQVRQKAGTTFLPCISFAGSEELVFTN